MADAKVADKKTNKKKKKNKKNSPTGRCYINSSFGNTMVTFTDPAGNTLCWSSSGLLGFKGSRKGTPFVAQVVAEDAGKKALGHGVKSVEVFVKGPGSGREMAVRSINNLGIRVTILKDITPLPHNGCRPPKKRRT